jgi:HPt (histidine-containing phosphotransfer) domain-containing protein
VVRLCRQGQIAAAIVALKPLSALLLDAEQTLARHYQEWFTDASDGDTIIVAHGEAIPAAPLFDPTALYAVIGPENDEMGTLIARFLTEADRRFTTLHHLRDRIAHVPNLQDRKALATQARALAHVASLAGALALAQACRTLESCARPSSDLEHAPKDPASPSSHHDTLEGAFAAVEACLAETRQALVRGVSTAS